MNFLKKFRILQKSVSALMDDPLQENESTANYFLTAHCLMFLFFLMALINKHFFDIFSAIKTIWPIKSENFRNPFSVYGAVAFALGVPIFLFWRYLGKTEPCSGNIRAKRHYGTITFFSSIAANMVLLFIAAKLNLPEISLILSALNFFLWAKWSIHEYVKQGGS